MGSGLRALPVVSITSAIADEDGCVSELHLLIKRSWVELTTRALLVSAAPSVVSPQNIYTSNLFHGLFMGEQDGISGA